MSDMQAIAESFYGATSGVESIRPPVPTEAEIKFQRTADALYDKPEVKASIDPVPYGIQALRRSEEPGLYERTASYETVQFEAAFKDSDEPLAVIAAKAKEYRHIAADLNATPAQAQQFLDIIQAYVKAPPTDEAVEQMRIDARAGVREAHGDEGPALMALAQRMILRDPRLAAIMNNTGAGNDKRIVLGAIELAKAQRAQGRLR